MLHIFFYLKFIIDLVKDCEEKNLTGLRPYLFSYIFILAREHGGNQENKNILALLNSTILNDVNSKKHSHEFILHKVEILLFKVIF